MSSVYYVYVLFDAYAIPRWIGKGKGHRITASVRKQPRVGRNKQKLAFIKRTIKLIGEVPRVKIRQNLTEDEAFFIEKALIKAIGRHPNGPLLNWTDGGDGASGRVFSLKTLARISDMSRRASAAKTAKQRSNIALKAQAKLSPEELKLRALKAAAAQTPEQRSDKSRRGWITRRHNLIS